MVVTPTQEVTFASSSEAIATVSETGLVTAIAEGTATIEIEGVDDSAEIPVTVIPAVIPIELNVLPASLELEVGSTEQLVVTPEQEVTFTSQNEAIATVSETGLVTAIAEGTATIEIEGVDDSAEIPVTVIPAVIPIELNVLPASLELEVGST